MSAVKARPAREDPRVTRTRNLIREALAGMVQEKAFADISVGDIAERATVNRATFYAHFEDKNALLEDLVRSEYRANLAAHDPAGFHDVTSLVRSVALTTLEHVRGRKKTKIDKQFEPQLERAMQDELYRYLRLVLGEAEALVVSSSIIGMTLQWRSNKYKEAPDEIVERLTSVLMRGVRLH